MRQELGEGLQDPAELVGLFGRREGLRGGSVRTRQPPHQLQRLAQELTAPQETCLEPGQSCQVSVSVWSRAVEHLW